MTYKTNYELWNPALTSRRPSQMSDIDFVLSQTYPHVAMLPYMQCMHCNPLNYEDEPGSPTSFTTFSTSRESEEGSDYLSTSTTTVFDGGKCKRIRRRLRKLLKRLPGSNN